MEVAKPQPKWNVVQSKVKVKKNLAPGDSEIRQNLLTKFDAFC